MVDLGAIEWHALCQDEAFRQRLALLEQKRHQWVPRSRGRLATGVFVALIVFYALFPEDGFPVAGTITGLGILAFALYDSRGHVRSVGRGSIDPWLLALVTERAGMFFVEDSFAPPGLDATEPFLFDRRLKRVNGKFLAGKGELELTACATCTVDNGLKGRIYRVRPGRRDENMRVSDVKGPITLVLPRGTRFRPKRNGARFERVYFDDDRSFAEAFDVHSVSPEAAGRLLDSALRALLIEIADGGEARACFQGEQAFVLAPDPLQRIPPPDEQPVEDYARETVEAFRSVLTRLDRLCATVPRDDG